MRLAFLVAGMVGALGMFGSIIIGITEGPVWSVFCFAAAACMASETWIGLRRR